MKKFKKFISIALVATMAFPVSLFAKNDYGTAKNIIMMIPDGTSVETTTLARWYTEDLTLEVDSFLTGMVSVNNSSTPIADSAPSGTALATGTKTDTPFIASYPAQDIELPGADKFEAKRAKMPLATILEAAKTLDKSTGIISTSNVQHATPADFSSHYPDRNEYQILREQQVYNGMDVVLGAGSKHLEASERKDGEDLIAEIKALGYDYVTDTAGLKNSKADKIWGMFDESAMTYDIDRDPAKEPALAEMTSKAIEVLSKNDKGFFLMVEGSEVDWANHANDPVAAIYDYLAFDKAVKVAKDFAEKTPGTVLIVVSDHGTGGLTLGNPTITKGYDKVKLEEVTRVIKAAKMTSEKAATLVAEDRSNIAQVMADNYGITKFNEGELEALKALDSK